MSTPSAAYKEHARVHARRRKPIQRERAFHMAVAQYLDRALPDSCWWTTFPAGGGGKARGGQLKAMGLKAGVADIMIIAPASVGADILWLELKMPKGPGPSPAQIAFAQRMRRFGGIGVAVVRTLEEVEKALRDFRIKPRASVLWRPA